MRSGFQAGEHGSRPWRPNAGSVHRRPGLRRRPQSAKADFV